MRVKLINHTQDALENMYISARTCYSKESPVEMAQIEDYDRFNVLMREKMFKTVSNAIKSGHLTIAEHYNFTFAIEGVSRACTHQLVRHRHCTFSQQSQRYVKFDKASYYEPQSILHNREADAIYNKFLIDVQQTYEKLVELGIAPEDARYVLPNAALSNITVTLNLRELMHICNLRLCTRAQTEIRHMVREMVKEVLRVEPMLEEFLVAKCDIHGYCDEEKSCGKRPRIVSLVHESKI